MALPSCTLALTLALLPVIFAAMEHMPPFPPLQHDGQTSEGLTQRLPRQAPQTKVIRGKDPNSRRPPSGSQSNIINNNNNRLPGLPSSPGHVIPGHFGPGQFPQGPPPGEGAQIPWLPPGFIPGQLPPLPPRPPPIPPRPKEECKNKLDDDGVQPGNLTCFSCKLDFRNGTYQWDHDCLSHHGRNVSKSNLVRCGPNDDYCKVERTEVNGVLTMLTRECSKGCHFGCRPKGFGISYETCSKCCQSDYCNHEYPLSLAPSFRPLSPSLLFCGLGLYLLLLSYSRGPVD